MSEKKKKFDKLGSLKKTLNIWSQRDLSIAGRINIIKTLALSKLVFISSVMNTPKEFSKEVDKITFDFIWDHKPAKIKKTTLIKQKTAGGLDMKDFSLFDKALKLTWVKRLCSNSNAPWQYITVNKKMVFFPHWYQAGIKQISDLFDSCEGHFLPFNSFCSKFNVKCSFLQYYSILSSIPQNWKKLLQECSKDSVTPPTSICSLSCKAIYSTLLYLEDLPPPTSEKKTFSVWRREK